MHFLRTNLLAGSGAGYDGTSSPAKWRSWLKRRILAVVTIHFISLLPTTNPAARYAASFFHVSPGLISIQSLFTNRRYRHRRVARVTLELKLL